MYALKIWKYLAINVQFDSRYFWILSAYTVVLIADTYS